MSAEPLVSVVTPFYNTSAHLEECIESVLHQTYGNWEYVLVDNWSTDKSSEIAAHYAARYPEKLRLVRTSAFLSQVQNYNFALGCMSHEATYCKVVQADDWLFPDCIGSMVQVAEAHPKVGIVAAYLLEGDTVRLNGLPYPSPAVPGREVGRLYFLRDAYLFGSPTSILMRSDLVRERKPFYEERYAPFEDGHVCFDLLTVADFGFVHQVLTYSRRDNDGITSSVREFGLGPFLRLSMLVAHGRQYLSQAEYDYLLKRAEREYFMYLATAACARKRPTDDFWRFHEHGLRAIDYALDKWRVAKHLPRALIDRAYNKCWYLLDKL